MIAMAGQNHFHGAFDFWEWSAPIYETPEELITAFGAVNLQGKALKRLCVIGEGSFPDTADAQDNTEFPCEASFYEPLQFIFQDDSTLEFLPMARGRARLGVNTIPVGLTLGLNPSNCDAQTLFGKELAGVGLRESPIFIEKILTTYYQSYPILKSTHFSWEKPEPALGCKQASGEAFRYAIWFENGYSLQFVLDDDQLKSRVQYSLRLCYQGVPVIIPVSRIQAAQTAKDWITIVPGYGTAGNMQICPCVSHGSSEPVSWAALKGQSPNFALSMDSDLCGVFLSAILSQHFKPDARQNRYPHSDETPAFDWYGCNAYPVEAVRALLSTVRETAQLLETDCESKLLDPIKEGFTPYASKSQLPQEEHAAWIKNNIPIAIDFYHRFSDHLESMLDYSCRDGCDVILFIGP